MTEEELKKLEEFEDIFGNTPFQNIQKIKEYIQNNFVSVDLYNKEKENNKELKKANKKLQADIEIKDKVINYIAKHTYIRTGENGVLGTITEEVIEHLYKKVEEEK